LSWRLGWHVVDAIVDRRPVVNPLQRLQRLLFELYSRDIRTLTQPLDHNLSGSTSEFNVNINLIQYHTP
jgi:hypothetical protein